MKRAIKSFEANADVAKMLDAAQKDGVLIVELINAVLLKHGRKTICNILKARGKAAIKYQGFERN